VGSDRGALQAAMKTITDRVPRKAVMLMSPDEDAGKVAVMAMVPKDQQGRLKAGDWVRETVGVMGGKGGGKPDSAQGAGLTVGVRRRALPGQGVRDAIKAAEPRPPFRGARN
jgi:alanyl-tRNA synthetase